MGVCVCVCVRAIISVDPRFCLEDVNSLALASSIGRIMLEYSQFVSFWVLSFICRSFPWFPFPCDFCSDLVVGLLCFLARTCGFCRKRY